MKWCSLSAAGARHHDRHHDRRHDRRHGPRADRREDRQEGGFAGLPSYRYRREDRREVGVAGLPSCRYHRRAGRRQVVQVVREARVGGRRRYHHPLRPARRA